MVFKTKLEIRTAETKLLEHSYIYFVDESSIIKNPDLLKFNSENWWYAFKLCLIISSFQNR